jgi:hypothetical protein
MKYIIIKESILDKTLLSYPQDTDERITCNVLFSLLNFSCLKISEELFNIYKLEWNGKYVETTENVATKGSIHFSEIRDIAKEFEASSDGYGGVKVPVEMTDELRGYVLEFMKLFAKEIIDDEFDKRYLQMKNTSNLESASWEIQKHEAKEWLTYQGSEGHATPFLDYISQERQIDKTELSNKILQKAEAYEDQLSTMLVDMQKIKKLFESATSIRDINILYEDYFGVLMPSSQAIELGRTVSETDWTRTNEVKIYEFNF